MAVDETPPSEIVERSLSFAGSTIKARYRVNEVSAVRRDVVVYTAAELRYGRPVALQVLRDDIAAHPEFVAAVRAQASTLAISPHAYRGLQRVYACDLTERGELFLALEPVKGITLREFIDTRGPLELSTALRIASQVGEALETLHHNRLVHGELGPTAVLVATDPTGMERVTLVGVELTAAYRTAIGRRLRDGASPPYAAPEQLVDGGETTAASDQYALGLLLRELLGASSAGATAGADTPLSALPPSVERIITTALAARPEERYPSISVMMNDVWGAQAALVPEEGRSRSVKPAPSIHRKHRARMRPSVPLAAIVAMAVIVLVLSAALVDRLVLRPRARAAAPAVSPVTVQQRATPLSDRQPPAQPPGAGAPSAMPAPPAAAPRIAEPRAVKDRAPENVAAPAIPRDGGSAPPVVRPQPAVAAPVMKAPGHPAESAAPPPRPAQVAPRKADESDGSAIIDWLLQNRR